MQSLQQQQNWHGMDKFWRRLFRPRPKYRPSKHALWQVPISRYHLSSAAHTPMIRAHHSHDPSHLLPAGLARTPPALPPRTLCSHPPSACMPTHLLCPPCSCTISPQLMSLHGHTSWASTLSCMVPRGQAMAAQPLQRVCWSTHVGPACSQWWQIPGHNAAAHT